MIKLYNCTRESAIATISGLLQNKEVTAANCLEYLTTRTSNTILDLRKNGIEIKNKRINIKSGKYYISYKLVKTEANFNKALRFKESLISELKSKRSKQEKSTKKAEKALLALGFKRLNP